MEASFFDKMKYFRFRLFWRRETDPQEKDEELSALENMSLKWQTDRDFHFLSSWRSQKNNIDYNIIIRIKPDLIGVFKVRSLLWSHGHQEKVEAKYGDEDANSFGGFQCHVIVAIKIVLKF